MFAHVFLLVLKLDNKKSPADRIGGRGLYSKKYFSTQPHAAAFNKKEKGDKKNVDKQNNGKQKHTVNNNCGVAKCNVF